MARLIKRYGNRKLYDTGDSRYVSLEDVSRMIRDGEDVRVVDNASSEDVTALTLTLVIAEEGRKKNDYLPSELLHDLIRAGEAAVKERVRKFQSGVDRFVKKSMDRIVPVRKVKDEMALLRQRLDELERAVTENATAAEQTGHAGAEAKSKHSGRGKAGKKKRPGKTGNAKK